MQASEFIQTLTQGLFGILTFDTFISPAILLLCYYLGAVILPILIYRFIYRKFKKISPAGLPEVEKVTEKIGLKFSPKWIFILSFLAFEICWRIFFEFFIAYFQIREALMSSGVT